jgi:hypothetical protein
MCSISSWAVATGTGISPDSRYSIPSLWLPTSWEDVMERSNMVIETESKRSPCTAKVIAFTGSIPASAGCAKPTSSLRSHWSSRGKAHTYLFFSWHLYDLAAAKL